MNIELHNQTGKIISTEIVEDKFIYATVLLAVSNIIIEDVLIINSFGINGQPQNESSCILFCSDKDSTQYYAHVIDLDNIKAIPNGLVIYGRGQNYIFFMDNGSIEIKNSNANIKLNGSSIEITGNVKITGNLEVSGNSTLSGSGTTIAGKTFVSHKHDGVTTGSGSTGGVL